MTLISTTSVYAPTGLVSKEQISIIKDPDLVILAGIVVYIVYIYCIYMSIYCIDVCI